MKNNDNDKLLAHKRAVDAERRQRVLMAKRARAARAAQAMSRIASANRRTTS